ncbi:diguanylate cyclase (GGDEF)-like protein [Nitrospirillum amazonense]|uniref:Diguanylate cyclase (GGDEF)-like protein n=1 Tax=Nitrospirillum amazonense TaxID=28077 RepID=A0A560K6S3_9PROT|nr:EAL domain-containing protein [Nitrospirillum amazonense]TWB77524.1 diguanylate cyclase (GGDEF)-like protein [Nitrospirillum amazonense]
MTKPHAIRSSVPGPRLLGIRLPRWVCAWRVRHARRQEAMRRHQMTVVFWRSLAVRQAALALLSALVIGAILSLIQGIAQAERERAKFANAGRMVLDLVENTASAAVWNLDPDLASGLVRSVLAIDGVRAVRLVEMPDRVLADGARDLPPAEEGGAFWRGWLSGARFTSVFQDLARTQRLLYRPAGSPRNSPIIGRLELEMDTSRAAADYAAFIRTTVLGGLVRDLALGVVLALLLHTFLTRPLRAVGLAVASIDPSRPGAARLPDFPRQADNELGYLVRRFNEVLRLLDRSRSDMEQLATHDVLTGLPNRLLLQRRLEEALRRRERRLYNPELARQEEPCGRIDRAGGRGIALFFLDLDRFKHVNDSLGHDVGDRLLKAVAGRLRDCIGEDDMLGRLGGDEFLVVTENALEPVDAAVLAERLLKALESPLMVEGGHLLHAGASIGVALAGEGPPNGDADTASTLLRQADTALYAAKAAGRGQYRFFSREMSERAENRLSTEANLRQALSIGSFELYFQPKVRAADQALVGAEALVRWKHDGQLVQPGAFMTVAEDSGLIMELGSWVLEQAVREATHWTKLLPDFHIAVNVSARQIIAPGFVERVRDCLARSGVPADRIEIEVTESVMVDSARSLEVLWRLKRLGVRIAVDDFGTGFSSLSYLRQMPIDTLKIDRAFVQDLPRDSAIAAMILTLGARLGLEVVAEGVEREEQLAWLVAEGCPVVQGFFIAEPMPARQLEARFLHPLVMAQEESREGRSA